MKLKAIIFMAITALMSLSVQASANNSGQTVRCALLIGIDHYGKKHTPGVAERNLWGALNGALNDVRALEKVLTERYGFRVQRLTNESATHAGIKNAIHTHLAQCVKQPDDVAYLHFSGHGQQIPDDNGDEFDGYDESIVPYDNRGFRNGTRNIRDDQIERWLKPIQQKTSNLILSFDSCHAGTATRGTGTPRGGKPSSPPASTARGSRDKNTFAWSSGDQANIVFLAGSASHEPAYEGWLSGCKDTSERCKMGRFTNHLVRELRHADSETTYEELVARIRGQMLSIQEGQNPQVHGELRRKLFSTKRKFEPPHSFPVPKRGADGDLFVEAGALHGITRGTVFAVYRSEKELMHSPEPRAFLRVKELTGARATCELVEGNPDFFSKPSRAIEHLNHSDSMLVSLAPNLRALRPKLEAILKEPIFRFATLLPRSRRARQESSVHVYRRGGKLLLSQRDGGNIHFPTPDSSKVSVPSLSIRNVQAAEWIAAALRARFLRSRLLGLENREPGSRLGLKITVKKAQKSVVKKCSPHSGKPRPGGCGAEYQSIIPGVADGFSIGRDCLCVEVENSDSHRPLYLSLLELWPNGFIHPLYPKGQVENRLPPGATRSMKFGVGPPAGDYTLKILATTAASNFAKAFKFKQKDLEGLHPDKKKRQRGVATQKLCGINCLMSLVSPQERSGGDMISIGSTEGQTWHSSNIHYRMTQ